MDGEEYQSSPLTEDWPPTPVPRPNGFMTLQGQKWFVAEGYSIPASSVYIVLGAMAFLMAVPLLRR